MPNPRIEKSAPKPSMVRKLASLIKSKRVMVFIDGSNLYYTMHSIGSRFDFSRFQNWLRTRCTLVDIHYYTAFDPEDDKQADFLTEMENLGYQIHKKPIKWVIDHHKGNMDVELAVDVMARIEGYDTMLLISGDGDFSYLCQTLETMHKGTIVFSMGGYTAQELHDSADNYFFMERVKNVWEMSKRGGGAKRKTSSTSKEVVQDFKPTPLPATDNIPRIYI